MEIIHIENNFTEEIENYKGTVVVDFWASWCGPCRMFASVFEEVSKEESNIKFAKVDVDKEEEVARKYGVMSIPTVIIFKDGKEVKRNTGFMDKDNLLDFIKGI